jgi:hypothetical protein
MVGTAGVSPCQALARAGATKAKYVLIADDRGYLLLFFALRFVNEDKATPECRP